MQGKFFSDVYASFVLHAVYCVWTVIHLSHKKSMKYSGHRKLLCELSKLSKCNAFNLLGY